MIYIIMCGRLGNQLFQYSFAEVLREMTGQEIAIDFTAIDNVCNSEWRNYLSDYDNVKYHIVKKNDYYPIQRFIYKIAKTFRPKHDARAQLRFDNKWQRILNNLGVIYYESDYEYHNFTIPKTKNIIVRGWFESEKYFISIRNRLKKEYVLKNELSEDNKKTVNVLLNTPAICITIRRGNFTDEQYRDKLLVCTKEYYYKALEYILNIHPECIIYVCSDDIVWCKENLQFANDVIFENSAPYSEKLFIMSLCKHFVLSNSTFSWWAQFLSDNEDKIVVAPDIWRRGELSPKDIYSSDWVLLNSEGTIV